MVVFNLLVGFAHHHRLNGRQEFRDDQGREPEGYAELQGSSNVPAKDSATAHPAGHAYLAAEALNQIPDLPAFEGERFVQAARAFRAN